MTVPAPGRSQGAPSDISETPDLALTQAVAAWLGQFGRTLKTCRLYDEANPTVVRFREELARSLTELLTGRESLRLDVSSSTLSFGGEVVHVARSREDNLSGVLHRDGIRALTLVSGIESSELDAFLDLILRVSGPAPGEDDLVTLLWDANLAHVVVETVPLEGEADGGAEEMDDDKPATAWPRQEASAPSVPPPSAASAGATGRSDDWTTDERGGDTDQLFDALESGALHEIARFQQEHENAVAVDVTTQVLRVLEDCSVSGLEDGDREVLIAFAPRVLRESLALGQWENASLALVLLRGYDAEWGVGDFAAGLSGPFAVTTRRLVATLDQQPAKGIEAFLALGREFGPPAAEWLMHVLAESQQMRVRRPLARAIAELLAGHPERLLPWLSDQRWYVVRNVVHILGWIGGDEIAGYLGAVAEHPELRVRREIVAALAQVERDAARPLLVKMLWSADEPLFVAILHQLAQDPHASIADILLELLNADSSAARSSTEKRALFMALATRGDAVLPALEAELLEGGLLSRRPESNRQAIALCIARIGSPRARAILERGLHSNRGAVRKACQIAGATKGSS